MFHYVKIIRPLNGIMSAIAVYIATVIAGALLYPSIPVLYGLIVVFLISSGGMVINDYFDVVADRINKPERPIPSGKISRRTAFIYSVVLFIAGIFFSYLINIYCFYTTILASLILVLYSRNLKKILMIGHLSISFLVALNFIFGGLIITTSMKVLLPIIILAIMAFLSNVGREIFKAVEDVLGDKHSGIKTLPVKYGVMKSKMIATLFIMAAIILSFIPYFLAILGEVYLFFVVIADIVFVIAIVIPKNMNAMLCKIAMNIALLAFLMGAIAAVMA